MRMLIKTLLLLTIMRNSKLDAGVYAKVQSRTQEFVTKTHVSVSCVCVCVRVSESEKLFKNIRDPVTRCNKSISLLYEHSRLTPFPIHLLFECSHHQFLVLYDLTRRLESHHIV